MTKAAASITLDALLTEFCVSHLRHLRGNDVRYLRNCLSRVRTPRLEIAELIEDLANELLDLSENISERHRQRRQKNHSTSSPGRGCAAASDLASC